jgi:Zn-dependent protease/CBS domain-containing protein
MKWSLRIGRVAGIDVYIHITFLLLLAWVGFMFYEASGRFVDVFKGMGVILALFGIVLLHELGHALAARRYGIGTRDITLLPIGGVARLERMPDDPKQELVVALAGPAVNIVLAVLFLGVVLVGGSVPALENVLDGSLSFLAYLFWANLFMAGFNLIPAFPMDGGRVLRALLALKLDYAVATQIAANVGKVMAVLFAVWGVWGGNPMLFLIALFVWMGAGAEAAMAQRRALRSGVPISRVMFTDFQTLDPHQSLAQALPFVTGNFQPEFPVEDGERLVGMITRDELLKAVNMGRAEWRVADVMEPKLVTAAPNEMLETVFVRMQEQQRPTLPVVEEGQIVGMVTAEQLGRVLMMAAAMRQGRRVVPGERIVV